jgi:hypothetical protein
MSFKHYHIPSREGAWNHFATVFRNFRVNQVPMDAITLVVTRKALEDLRRDWDDMRELIPGQPVPPALEEGFVPTCVEDCDAMCQDPRVYRDLTEVEIEAKVQAGVDHVMKAGTLLGCKTTFSGISWKAQIEYHVGGIVEAVLTWDPQ